MDDKKTQMTVATEVARAFFMGCALIAVRARFDLSNDALAQTASEIAGQCVDKMRPSLERIAELAAD